jgi:hypothetical protein
MLLAAALLAAIWPPPDIDATLRTLATRMRQLTEPQRRRSMQTIAASPLS